MTGLYQRQVKLTLMWSFIAACSAAVAVLEAIELKHWLILVGMGGTLIGALVSMYFSYRTLVSAREIHRLKMVPVKRL